MFRRSCPSTVLAAWRRPADISSRSAGPHAASSRAWRTAGLASRLERRALDRRRPATAPRPGPTSRAASPCSTSSSSSRREYRAAPGTTNPRTSPPDSSAFRNTANGVSANGADRSPISMPHRRSGLSDPYFAIASAYGSRRNGCGTSRPIKRSIRRSISGSSVAEHQLLGREGDLEVDLRELGLAVGAQILVAEALDDLEVAVHAGDHQDLLEDLRRLRQRVELGRMDAARHQVVARPFRRRLRQHRRLDLEEAVARRSTAGSPSSPDAAGSGCAASASGADRDSGI